MNKMTVLVVEDDAAIRNLMEITLRARDYGYLSAAGGESAILAAASRNPDMILLDLGLPDLDGVEIIRKVRSWSALRTSSAISARISSRWHPTMPPAWQPTAMEPSGWDT